MGYFEVDDRVMVIDQYKNHMGEYGSVVEVLTDGRLKVAMRKAGTIVVSVSAVELAPTKHEQLKRKICSELEKHDSNGFEYEYEDILKTFRQKSSLFDCDVCRLRYNGCVLFSKQVPVHIGKMIFEFYEEIV